MNLSPDWLAWEQTQKLIKAFADDADKLRFVGGAVRDSLLDREVGDIDAATTLAPQEVINLLEKSAIRAIPTGIKHGTITAIIYDKNSDAKHFEITTLRRDVSCDGRHAEVVFTDDWCEDAARRDFTMNALYLSIYGKLFDYFGGIEDARAGLVRFIGDARVRITEDYLRILRFFRFFACYGNGLPDKAALAACAEFAPKIETLSGERLQHEMLKLLAAPAPFSALELMQKTSVLEQVCGFNLNTVIPDAGFIHERSERLIKPSDVSSSQEEALDSSFRWYDKKNNKLLRLAILLLSATIKPADALAILSVRWRLSNELKKSLSVLIIHISDISLEITIARQKHLIRKLGAEVFSSLLLLKMALEPAENYSAMMAFAANWQPPIMPISGRDLIALGISEGKKLGEQLHALEILWEASDYTLSKEELQNLIAF